MSVHPSLRGANTLTGERSVWKRIERIQALMKKGKFDPEEDSIFGLPKVRTRMKVAKKKAAPKEEPVAAAEGEETPAEEPKPE